MYLTTACRSLAFLVFHVFMRVVIVQLFLFGEAVLDRVKILGEVIVAFWFVDRE